MDAGPAIDTDGARGACLGHPIDVPRPVVAAQAPGRGEVRHGASHQRGDDRVGDEAFVAEVALG